MIRTLGFKGTVAPGDTQVFVGNEITGEYAICELKVCFRKGCENKLRVYLIVSDSIAADIDGPNILEDYGQSGDNYITGDGETVTWPLDYPVEMHASYIKIVAENTDTEYHTVNAYVTISTQSSS